MSPMFKKKVVIVAGGLILFLTISYKYASRPMALTSQPTLNEDVIYQKIVHQSVFEKIPTHKENVTLLGKEIALAQPIQSIAQNELPQPKPKSYTTKAAPKSLPRKTPLQSYFVKDCDHFVDWPSPSVKAGCPQTYNLKDKTISIVIFLKNDLDSFPVQTFLSAVQFTKESGITITNVVLTFINDPISLDAHLANIEVMMRLTTNSIHIITTSSDSEWKAKLKGVHLANSEQVFLVDDTMLVNRGFLKPLLHLLEDRPNSLVTSHVDSLLPARIYAPYKDKQVHPDSQVWQETSLATYHVTLDMKMVRHENKEIQDLLPHMPSGGLTGESLAGTRTYLLSLLSKMRTGEPAELSLLSYMCGEGIIISKCSAVVRSNQYDPKPPETHDPSHLQSLYPLKDTNPNKKVLENCKDVNHYFQKNRQFIPDI